MSLDTNLSDAFTRVATENKALRILINGNVPDLSDLNTTATGNLVAAINEVLAAAGGSLTLDDVSDVILTSETDGDVLVYSSGDWVNTPLIGAIDSRIAAAEINDLDDVVITALATGQALVFDGTNWVNDDVAGSTPDASETVKGVVELATTGEAVTGTDTVRAVTPAGVDAALDARVVDASATVKGIVELATDAETTTGTDTVRATTPANVKAAIDARVVDASATVKGIVELATDAEAITGTDTVRATTPANVRAAIDDRIGSTNLMTYKGVIDASANPNYPAANAGDTYVISVAGKIGGGSGPNVEVGDMIVCKTDSTSSGNEATVGSAWNIIQKNIDGAVTGPASSTSANLASFNGTTGKIIADSGFAGSTGAIDTSTVLLPTRSAVKTYVDGYAQPLDTDLSAIAALTSAANKGLQSTGAGTWALYDLTAAGKALLDDADAAAQRTTLDVWSKSEIGAVTTDYVATFEAGLV